MRPATARAPAWWGAGPPLLLGALLLVAHAAAAAAPGSRFVKNGDRRVWPMPSDFPDGAPKLGLNVPYSEGYLESLRSYNRGGDPSVVDRLIKAAQLSRRSTGVMGPGPNPQPRYALIDCTPMFIQERSWLDVLRRVTMRLYTCHAICLDYPACTTTTPLAYVEPAPAVPPAPAVAGGRRLAALTQCGMRVLRADDGEGVVGGEVLDLSAGAGGAVCSNTPPRARNPDGGGMQYYFTAGEGGARNVSIWAQPGSELVDGLVLNTNDLWAGFEVQPLRLLNAAPGTDMWTRVMAPMRGALDLRASVAQVARALEGAAPTPADLRALWVVAPEPGTLSLSAQFLHAMDDNCGRWITFPFNGIAGLGGSVVAGYSNDTGPCSAVVNSMEKVGAYLAGIPVSSRKGGSCEIPNHPEYNTTTVTQCPAPARLGARLAAPLALEAPLHSVADKAVIRGCTTTPLFSLEAFPGFSTFRCGPAFAMPALETVINTGAFRETFQDAAVLLDALKEVGERRDLSASLPVTAKWLDLRVQANASHFEELIEEYYLRSMRELDNLQLGPQARQDRTAIITAVGLLLVATFQLPLAYDRNVRRTMASIANKCACGPDRTVRTGFVFVGALITLAAPIGAAMMSVILATKASEEEVLLVGYPEVLHISAPLGTKEGAVVPGERLGLDAVTAITVTQEPFTLGLVGICAACFLATICGAMFSAWHQWKDDAPLDHGGPMEDEEAHPMRPPVPNSSFRSTPAPSFRSTPPPTPPPKMKA